MFYKSAMWRNYRLEWTLTIWFRAFLQHQFLHSMDHRKIAVFTDHVSLHALFTVDPMSLQGTEECSALCCYDWFFVLTIIAALLTRWRRIWRLTCSIKDALN